MQRNTMEVPVSEIRDMFPVISFPDYQREPTVWGLDAKQRLIDSMLRMFDISSIYIYMLEEGNWECIDGRQRLNAIAAFLGRNPESQDNRFRLSISNEVGRETDSLLESIDGKSFAEIERMAESDGEVEGLVQALLGYEMTIVVLSDASSPEEFNLQFLRLNLGALMNAGEKLKAMVGEMRDTVFDVLGPDPFLRLADVPNRRFAREQIAAQVVLQAYTYRRSKEFTRSRHTDLQAFFKRQFEMDDVAHEVVEELEAVMAALEDQADNWSGLMKNRAITVSTLLLAWRQGIPNQGGAEEFVSFMQKFSVALQEKARQIRELEPEAKESKAYLIDFQRHVTQAAVERRAVEGRHSILRTQYEVFRNTGELGA